jgi:hypothetical protein
VNPSHRSFGVGVITPRWLFVLAAATPASHGSPRNTDETLEPLDVDAVQLGAVVGIGIHTGNPLLRTAAARLAQSSEYRGKIYGLEDSNDVHALVMELVEGPTLADS